MVLSFLCRACGPTLVYLALLTSYLWWKDSAGWPGAAVMVIVLHAACVATVLLTVGAAKTREMLRFGWREFWKNNTTRAEQIGSACMLLLLVALVSSMPVALLLSPAPDAAGGLIVFLVGVPLGLTALLVASDAWKHFVEYTGGDPDCDRSVLLLRRVVAFVRPAGRPLAILAAAFALLALGFALGVAASLELLKVSLQDRLEKEVRQQIEVQSPAAGPGPEVGSRP